MTVGVLAGGWLVSRNRARLPSFDELRMAVGVRALLVGFWVVVGAMFSETPVWVGDDNCQNYLRWRFGHERWHVGIAADDLVEGDDGRRIDIAGHLREISFHRHLSRRVASFFGGGS